MWDTGNIKCNKPDVMDDVSVKLNHYKNRGDGTKYSLPLLKP